MSRVSRWKPEKYDGEFRSASMDRLRKAANVVAEEARNKCPVGTISRPIYKTGPYAGEPWTARDAGSLKKTIRVTEKENDLGIDLTKMRNIRIYAGNYMVGYAQLVEFAGKKFLRPALNKSKQAIRSILENG